MSKLTGIIKLAGVVVLMAIPLYATTPLLQAGIFVMAAVIGGIGLVLLFGIAGQLSLAHAFFLALGAYSYTAFSAPKDDSGELLALGLPPIVSLVGALAVCAVAGYAFSFVSRRLSGIYLGIASLSLVFIGLYLLNDLHDLTGGFNGRAIDASAYPGIAFVDAGTDLTVLGVPFESTEKLWYFALIMVTLSMLTARNILRHRPGRALRAIRDGELGAAVIGVDVKKYKASVFVVSSMYAGLAGVIYGLCAGYIVPDSFGLTMSLDYVAIIVIGGMASLSGAALGAVFVIMIPQVLTIYGANLPFLGEPGSGFDAGTVSRFIYGIAIVLALRFAPGGLAELLGRRHRRHRPSPDEPAVDDPSTRELVSTAPQ